MILQWGVPNFFKEFVNILTTLHGFFIVWKRNIRLPNMWWSYIIIKEFARFSTLPIYFHHWIDFITVFYLNKTIFGWTMRMHLIFILHLRGLRLTWIAYEINFPSIVFLTSLFRITNNLSLKFDNLILQRYLTFFKRIRSFISIIRSILL